MSYTTRLMVMAMVFILFASFALADVPNMINYQGRLTETEGTPIDGQMLIKFKIYGSETGNDSLWWSGYQTVGVNNGFFDYKLGSVVPLPADLFSTGTERWLGITVSTDTEISPRVRITSMGYSHHTLRSDTSGYAIDIADDAVTSAKIQDDAVQEADLGFDPATQTELNTHEGHASAHHTKTTDASELSSGTLDDTRLSSNVPLENSANAFTAENTFNGTVKIGDSTFRADNNGISIGNGSTPSSTHLLHTERTYNTSSECYGHYSSILNTGAGYVYGHQLNVGCNTSQGNGKLYGIMSIIGDISGGTGRVYGLYANVHNNAAYGYNRYGVYAHSGDSSNAQDNSFGVHATAWGGENATGIDGYAEYAAESNWGLYGFARGGQHAWGIYAWAQGGSVNTYAGYFGGDVRVTGTFDNSKNNIIMDHPLDPENKYLKLSSVNSPEMKNVFDGVVTLNANGEATVELPEYFEALNENFRYQVTCIGGYAPVYIAEKIINNQFVIAGGQPGMEISWQVTGIRKDAFVQANPMEVEVDKPETEVGKYLAPEALGYGPELHINYEQNQHSAEPPQHEVRGE